MLFKIKYNTSLHSKLPKSTLLLKMDELRILEPNQLMQVMRHQVNADVYSCVANNLSKFNFDRLDKYQQLLGFINQSIGQNLVQTLEVSKLIALQMEGNIQHIHMIWMTYLTQYEQNYGILLKSMESFWMQEVYDLTFKQIETILLFYRKINSVVNEDLANEMCKQIHKLILKSTDNTNVDAYYCLMLILQQQPDFEYNVLHAECLKLLDKQINKQLQTNQILQDIKLFSVHPQTSINNITNYLNELKYHITPLQMRQILGLCQQVITNETTDLAPLLIKLDKWGPKMQTTSNAFQINTLKQLQYNNNELQQYIDQPTQLDLSDIQFILTINKKQPNKIADATEEITNEYLLNGLNKQRLQRDDFESIGKVLKLVESDEKLQHELRKYLQKYCYFY